MLLAIYAIIMLRSFLEVKPIDPANPYKLQKQLATNELESANISQVKTVNEESSEEQTSHPLFLYHI